MILQDIGYAKLANLTPQYGLCKHILCLLHEVSSRFYVLYLDFPSLNQTFHIVADSSFVPPLVYALMGSSRDVAIGPVAVVSLLLGTLLQKEIDYHTHPEEYLRLAFTATFFAGITQATLGILR